jgi:hypothetical protein
VDELEVEAKQKSTKGAHMAQLIRPCQGCQAALGRSIGKSGKLRRQGAKAKLCEEMKLPYRVLEK